MLSCSVPPRSELTSSQQVAVSSGASALHISGGVGSGKTTALAHRAVEQATRNAGASADSGPPRTVWVVAASAERARALSRQVEAIRSAENPPTGENSPTGNISLAGDDVPGVGTVAQWAARRLRQENSGTCRSILRPEQAQDLVGEVLSSLGFKDLARAPFEVWREIRVRAMQGDEQPIAASFPLDQTDFQAVQSAYRQRLERANALDLPRLIQAAMNVPPMTSCASLLVDDAHDLSTVERSFLRQMDTSSRTVIDSGGGAGEACLSGEASVQHIALAESFVPSLIGRGATIVVGKRWEDDEASPLDRAGTVQVASAASGSQEAQQIASRIRQKVDDGAWDPADVTVCAGTARVRETIEAALRAEDLRVRVPGRPFHGQAGPSDVLAYLHVLVNPHDDIHLTQIINRPSRGIGRKTQARIEAYAAEHNLSVWDAIPHADENKALTSRARRVLRAVRELLTPLVETLHDPKTPPARVRDIARDLIRDTEYLTNVTRGHTREQIEKEEQMERLMRQLPGSDWAANDHADSTARNALQRVLDRFALGMVDAEDVDARMREAVTLASIRGVRGVGSRVVIAAGLEENVCPGGWAVRRKDVLEDEREGLARAMASARDTLLLTWAQSRGSGREEEPTTRSRFLEALHEDGKPVPWVEAVSLRSGDDASGYRASLRAEQARSTASAPPTDADIDQIAAGQRVRHPKLGDGIVESVATDNGRRIAEVRFDERGTKTLQLKYAPLEVLE